MFDNEFVRKLALREDGAVTAQVMVVGL